MRVTVREYWSNPGLRLAIEMAARRQRAQALARLFTNLVNRVKAGHAAGTHLARQG
jgi:hypothetical protein